MSTDIRGHEALHQHHQTTVESPGEIKRREVSWTHTKKLDTFAGPGEIQRREVVLDPQVSSEETMSTEVELGCESWTFFCFKLLLNSGATDIVLVTLPSTAVEKAVAQYTSCCAMARGHRLNTSIVLAAVHGLLGLPGRCARSSLHSLAPFPPVPVPNKHPCFCGR